MKTKTGIFKNRIYIQQRTTTQDTAGEQVHAWSAVCNVLASIEPLTGKEFYQAQTAQSEVTHKITIRYRSGIDPTMRILFGTRYFNILTMYSPEERNVDLILMTKELYNNDGE